MELFSKKIVGSGFSPLSVIFENVPFKCPEGDGSATDDGVTDTLRYLIHHEDYNKPWSEQHILATLLTKAF